MQDVVINWHKSVCILNSQFILHVRSEKKVSKKECPSGHSLPVCNFLPQWVLLVSHPQGCTVFTQKRALALSVPLEIYGYQNGIPLPAGYCFSLNIKGKRVPQKYCFSTLFFSWVYITQSGPYNKFHCCSTKKPLKPMHYPLCALKCVFYCFTKTCLEPGEIKRLNLSSTWMAALYFYILAVAVHLG